MKFEKIEAIFADFNLNLSMKNASSWKFSFEMKKEKYVSISALSHLDSSFFAALIPW